MPRLRQDRSGDGPKEHLSYDEAGLILCYSARTVRRLVERGVLKAKYGKVARRDVEALWESWGGCEDPIAPDEACEIIGISRTSFFRLIEHEIIPAVQRGSKCLVFVSRRHAIMVRNLFQAAI